MNRQDELLEYERQQKLKQKRDQMQRDELAFKRQKEIRGYSADFESSGSLRQQGSFYKVLSALFFLAAIGIGAFSFFTYQRSYSEIEYLEKQISDLKNENSELTEKLKLKDQNISFENYKSRKMLSEAEKEKILYETSFNDGKTGWVTKNDNNVELSIGKNGYYFSHKNNEKSWITWNKSPLSGNENFLIECQIKKERGVDNYGYGVTWGLRDADNNISLKISGNGYYTLSKSVNGVIKALIPWKQSPHINRFDNENKITIKKTEDKLDIFINDKWVDSAPNVAFTGKNIGFAVDNRQSVTIRNLVITKLIKKESIFSENFIDNRNNWAEKDSEDVELKVERGYIFSHNRPDKSWLTWKSIDIKSGENFLIECEMEKISGINNNGYGIVFGLRDSSNCFFYQISGDGHYRFYKSLNGRYSQIIPWQKTRFVNRFNNNNKLSIKKQGSYLNFYVNGMYVNKTPFQAFMGNNIGFRIDMQQKVKFKSLNVSKI